MAVPPDYDGPTPSSPMSHDEVLQIAAHLRAQKTLHAKFVYRILIELKAQLQALPSLVDVPIPEGTHINVCGDTHGQYYDLLHIFEVCNHHGTTM